MIKNETKFVNNMFQRLSENSLVHNALHDKTFNLNQWRPFPFYIFSEFMSSLNLYKITNQARFLEILEQNIDMIINERDCDYRYIDQGREKIGHGWGCNYLIEGLWTHDAMTSSCIAFPIALYIVECLRDPQLSSERKSKIEKYLQICKNVADDFLDDIKDCEKGAYLHQPWMKDIEPSNHTAVYICLLLAVYKLTNDKKYFFAAERLATYIKATFREDENGTICWPYRGDMLNQKSTHGERYWKSTWVVYAMLLCYRTNCVFTEADIMRLTYTVKTNLIRDGIAVYDSLSRQAGVLVDQKRIEYHAQKGQDSPLKRLINFIPLAIVDNEVAKNLQNAIIENQFYKSSCEQFFEFDNHCLLEGLTCFLDYNRSVFNFNFDHLHPSSLTKTRTNYA